MSRQACGLSKSPSTFVAFVWPLSSVNTRMTGEMTFLTECHATRVTFEGLFSSMSTRVLVEIAFASEPFLALSALKRRPTRTRLSL